MSRSIARFLLPSLFGLALSTGCADAPSGNTTAEVGHDGKEHGQTKAPALSTANAAQAKGAPTR